MDVRRIALIAGLAVVSYLLVYNWSQDHATTAPQEQVSSSQAAPSSSDVPAADTAPAAQAQVDDGSDVPQAPTESTPGTAADAGDRIAVRTDVLNLAIDLNGGDVVGASLPEYPTSDETPDIPFTILENGQRTYTAMSGLYGADGIDSNGRARYTTAKTSYRLGDDQDQLTVTLTHTGDNGVVVDKVITLTRGSYLVDVRYDIQNGSPDPVKMGLFSQLKRDHSKDPSAGRSVGKRAFLGVAMTTPEDRYKKISFGDMDDGDFTVDQKGGWVAFLQHYFLSAWVPSPDQNYAYFAKKLSNGFYYAGYKAPLMSIAPGDSATTGAQLYVGPKDQDRLAEISPHLELTVDYGILWWAAQPLFKLLTFMHGLTGNWGWAIVLMTLTVKFLLYPLTASSYRSMAKMRKFAPKMTQLREQYGDDRQRLGQEMMKLYKKEKLNPMGGCLPILIQMPVFIALYWVLNEAVELRQSPFIFWIHDLSVKDPFFVLPLLMGASMFFQMQMQQQPGMDPMQARMMKFMPLIFTFMFLWFPAGLTLYWFVNNVSTIVQQWIVNRQFQKAEAQKST